MLANTVINPCPGPPPRFSDAQLARNTAPVLVIAAEDDVFGDGKSLVARAVKVGWGAPEAMKGVAAALLPHSRPGRLLTAGMGVCSVCACVANCG